MRARLLLIVCLCCHVRSIVDSLRDEPAGNLWQGGGDESSRNVNQSTGCKLEGMVNDLVPKLILGDYALKGFNEVALSGATLAAASWVGLSMATSITEWEWKRDCNFRARIAFSFTDTTKVSKTAELVLNGVVKTARQVEMTRSHDDEDIIRLADESYPAAQFAFVATGEQIQLSGSNIFEFPDHFMGIPLLGKCELSIPWAEGFFQVEEARTPHMRFLTLMVQFKSMSKGETERYAIHLAHSATAHAPALVGHDAPEKQSTAADGFWKILLHGGNKFGLFKCRQPEAKHILGNYTYASHTVYSSMTLHVKKWEILGQCEFGITVQVHMDTFSGRYTGEEVALKGTGENLVESEFTFALANPVETQYPFVIKSISANAPVHGHIKHVQEMRVKIEWERGLLGTALSGPGMLLSAPGKLLSAVGGYLPGAATVGSVLSGPGDLLQDGFLSEAALSYVEDAP